MNNSPCTKSTRVRFDQGAALFVAVVSLVIVTGFVTTLLTAVDTERTGVVLEGDRLQATKLAEGVLEIAENEFLTALAQNVVLPEPPAGAPFQAYSGDHQARFGPVHWTVAHSTTLDGAGNESVIAPGNRVDALSGLQLTIEPYVLQADVKVGTSSVRMRRHIEVQKTPIFQFLAYYAGDLEILPGPAMVLNGRIHTNSDLYMSSGASLTISSKYVRTANDFFRRRKDTAANTNGWIKVQDAATNVPVTLPQASDLAALGISSGYGIDSSFTGWDLDSNGIFDLPGEMAPFKSVAEDLFHGTLQTGEHGVTELHPPDVAAIQPYVAADGGDYVQTAPGTFAHVAPGTGTHSKSHFHANADLVVIDTQVFNRAGQNITAQMPADFLTTKNVWDQRESRTVSCTQIDVSRLGDMDGNPETYDPCPRYPANGLLFVTRSNSEASQPGGVVLTKGAELNVPQKWNSANYSSGSGSSGSGGGLGGLLGGVGGVVGGLLGGSAPAGAHVFAAAEKVGLTVVSPQPVYVHGDYNTIGKKPAAVISDAVNLLSNAWDFTKAAGQIKNASDTTYNLAMIMGHLATNGAQYSGGFENLPRFHENWNNKTCTILGSFVSPWFSTVATGPWIYGGAWYSAPNRNWSYDASFDQGKLPPFTPMVVDARTVAWEVSK